MLYNLELAAVAVKAVFGDLSFLKLFTSIPIAGSQLRYLAQYCSGVTHKCFNSNQFLHVGS